jgi:hypothetical protein
MLYVLVIFAVIVAGFSFSTRSRSRDARPAPNAVLSIDGVPVRPGDLRVRNALIAAQDSRAATFLRRALVTAEALRAEDGKYTSDTRRLAPERPANVVLHVLHVGDEGLRMTAIDNSTLRQCDIFAGDSARWAFGYAYDPRVPACGKLR